MKISRLLAMLLAFTLILCATLVTVGCTPDVAVICTSHTDADGDGKCDTDGCGAAVEVKLPTDNKFNEDGELYLFKDGAPTFKFVVGQDASNLISDIMELNDAIAELTKDNVAPKVENYSSDEIAVEILIGTVTTRGEQYVVDKYTYGSSGYVVKQIGTKIIVNGGSNAAVKKAISHLKTSVFKIKKTNDPYGTFVMTNDSVYDVKQSNYSLTDIKIADQSIRNYVITYPAYDPYAKANAGTIQSLR